MEEKKIPFNQLKEAVLCQLKEHGYKDSTLTNYRRFYDRITSFLTNNGIVYYSSEIGKEFLASTHVKSITQVAYTCAVRRLDDYINNRPYRCHHGGETLRIPECYVEVLNSYICRCKEKGNRKSTVKAKEVTITQLLNFLWENDCYELSCLNPSLLTRALLIYRNKDNYSQVREFLTYLSNTGITTIDFSGIVPHYRKKKVLPTVYTVDEITRLEQTINPTTEKGCRDLAMILLATRMGLRAGDISKLRCDEIDFSNGYIRIIQEKTLVPLILQMPVDVSVAIRNHLDNRTRNSDEYVFHSLSAPYERVTPSIIRHAVNDYLIAAKIDTSERKCGPHALRSSMASSMVNDGASYETVRRILGHTDSDVIKHYARSDIANLKLCSIDAPPASGLFKKYLHGEEMISHV